MFARNWWIVGLRGLGAILFGVTAILWPVITLVVLVTIFGVYVIVDGLFTIVIGIWGRKEDRSNSWLMVLDGIVRIVAGVIVVVLPGITSVAFVFVLAIWAVISGLLEIIMAIRLRKEIEGEWALVLSGFLSMLFGAILFIRPAAGALGGVFLIGFYAILFGILLIVFAFQMRKRKNALNKIMSENNS
jgi:uncharacterized membrane protein HdeD (DUF308 family)